MKRLIIPVLFLAHIGWAQNHVSQETVKVYEKETIVPGAGVLEVPVSFDQASLLRSLPADLKDLSIQGIDLVYTTFKENPAFDQEALNTRRMNTLIKKLPVAENPLIRWRAIGQSEAVDKYAARKLFHGFVIYYRPKPTAESIEGEIAFIDGYVGEGTSSAFATNQDEVVPEEELAIESVAIVYDSSPILSTEPVAMEVRSPYGVTEADSYVVSTGEVAYAWTPYNYNALPEADFNIMKETYERHPNWEKTLVVMDVTGSMSPYIAKTMAWVKATQESSQIDAFVFFNDGDNASDYKKRVGHVGGIYGVHNTTFGGVYQEMRKTMRRGGGGDCPENNVEASLDGIRDYPNCDEIVMMADNWATPRDLSLAKQLEKPVHVILCGANYGINIEYLQLAYDSGGSVHTIEEDLEMRSIKPGKQFKLGKSYFTLIKGRIVRAQHKS